MRAFVRPALTALSIVCLSVSITALGADVALAQSKEMAPAQGAQTPQLKQIPLTEKQIQGVLSAQKDMDAITAKLPENSKPDPKVMTQLEAVAKKNGFASYDEYNSVMDNIGLVLGGFDPSTKRDPPQGKPWERRGGSRRPALTGLAGVPRTAARRSTRRSSDRPPGQRSARRAARGSRATGW
jgi:hypothetical protein